MKKLFLCLFVSVVLTETVGLSEASAPTASLPPKKPNVIIFFTDDISAREFPVYNTPAWTNPLREDTSDVSLRARTPVMDRLAREGCYVQTAWSATLCKPSRAMILSGRYAHRQGWWCNKQLGQRVRPDGKTEHWPIYKSSPLLVSHVAKMGGYDTYWAGKFHLTGDYLAYGFDEAFITPGLLSEPTNPNSDFQLDYEKRDGERVLVNQDTGLRVETYAHDSYYWQPNVRLVNHPSARGEVVWWPNERAKDAAYGLSSYGPDLEMRFTFDFMDRKRAEGNPFFIYHACHLGHDSFDWLDPDNPSRWPGTPNVSWNGEGYERTVPRVEGDAGEYETFDTVSESGMHRHIEYIDYQIWCYLEKLKAMGELDNTVLIITSDNGSGGYGKNSKDRQKGCHVPMIVYAPGMVRKGEQAILVSLTDMLPTVAELAGVTLPEAYEVDGESLVPFLYGEQDTHRDWIFSYSGGKPIIRGHHVLRDANKRWWDVSSQPEDLIGFERIENWNKVSAAGQAERDVLQSVLPVLTAPYTGDAAQNGGY